MAGVDLTFARATYSDKVLLDRCTISRNPDSYRDSVLDPETGELSGGDDLDVVATAVPGKAKERLTRAGAESNDDVGGAPKSTIQYEVALDYDTAVALDLRLGDVITWTACRDDPLLVGVSMNVAEVVIGTILIARKLICVRRVDAVDRH